MGRFAALDCPSRSERLLPSPDKPDPTFGSVSWPTRDGQFLPLATGGFLASHLVVFASSATAGVRPDRPVTFLPLREPQTHDQADVPVLPLEE